VPRLEYFDVEIGLPWGLGKIGGRWSPDTAEREAAWEMYVELVTRVTVEELGPEEGLLREALTSLYSLFPTTRGILRDHGPTVAKPRGQATQSFGSIAVAILNQVLRPLLAKWHPLLADHEHRRPEGVSQAEHERLWAHNADLRRDLGEVRQTLTAYADLLAAVAGVTPIHAEPSGSRNRRRLPER
jgi:hypothetical protein